MSDEVQPVAVDMDKLGELLDNANARDASAELERALEAVQDESRRRGLRAFVDVLRVVTVALRETKMPLEARAEMLPRMVTIAMGAKAPIPTRDYKGKIKPGSRDPLASLMD